MEVSTFKAEAAHARIAGRSPLLRLQSDERLVALTRKGNHAAFEALVARYQTRLAGFCRHMLGSREDAEDVLQEVFAAAFNAIQADDREILVRPWLYRIARNRSLNHLRRQKPIGVDTMDVHLADQGQTTADKAHRREEFRQLIEDVEGLAETQRTALLLREMEHLSYEQIALAMDTTVPAVKSLLVRARMGLAEAAESRLLTCDEVRLELGEAAEGLKRLSSPVRRHVRDCERCGAFRDHLRDTNKTLAAVFPVGGLLLFKNAILGWFGHGTGSAAGAAGAGAAGAGAAGAAGGVAATTGAGMASSAATAGLGALATKAAAGLAAAAVVTAGAVEARQAHHPVRHQAAVAAAPAVTPRPALPAPAPRVVHHTATLVPAAHAPEAAKPAEPKPKASVEPPKPAAPTVTTPATTTTPKPVVPVVAIPVPAPTQSVSDTATLPTTVTTPADDTSTTESAPADGSTGQPSSGEQAPPSSGQQSPPSSGQPPAPTSPVPPITVGPIVDGPEHGTPTR